MATKDYEFTSEQDFYDKSGLKDMSALEVLTRGQAPTKQYYKYNDAPGVFQNASFDPNAASNAQLAQLAGRAGASFDDIAKYLGSGVSADEEKSIYDELGIGALEERVFRPAPSTEQLFTDAFAAAGLADLKKQIEGLVGERRTKKDELNQRLQAVNENPWLSEMSRLTNVGNTKNFYETGIANLTEEQQQLVDLFNSGLGQVNDLVTRKTTDFANQNALDRSQLEYLIGKAEKELARRAEANASKVARYLPDFLSARNAATAPETISTSDGAVYAWDRDIGQFVQLRGPDPVEDPRVEWRETPLTGPELKLFDVPAGTTWGQVEDAGLQPKKTVSVEGQKLQTNINSGLRALATVKKELYGDENYDLNQPGDVRSNILFRESLGGARTYVTAKNELIDILARMRTGAAITADEEERYKKYLPAFSDPESTVRYKLQQFEKLFNEIAPAKMNELNATPSDSLFQEFEGGPVGLKAEGSGKTPYLSTLGKVTAYGSSAWKPGLDVDGKKGDPLRSPVTGTVIAAANNGGFGLQVKVRSSDGNEIWLSHLDSANVKPGQKVAAGQVIGTVGNTGTVIKGKGGDGSHVDITMPKSGGGYRTAKEVESYLRNIFV